MTQEEKRNHERINNLAPLLLNVEHPLLKKLSEDIFADYDVIMKFISMNNSLTGDIIVSSKIICRRDDKRGPVKFSEGVELLEGTPTRIGGSNRHPRPCFEEGYCTLRFKSKGLPIVDPFGWNVEIIKLNKI